MRYRSFAPLLLAAGSIAAALAGGLACSDGTPAVPPVPDAGVTGPAKPTTAQVINGLELYAAQGCAACHCNAGEGGCNIEAPSVQGARYEVLDANLRWASTADELPDLPDGFDPHPFKDRALTDEQLVNMAAFLSTTNGKASIEADSLVGKGYELYVTGTCISCHLMSGQGSNQGGIGQAIAGTDPDNLYFALSGGVPCHPLQYRVPTSSTGVPHPACGVLNEFITDNEVVRQLTDQPPPDIDDERALLAYFLAFVSPPASGGVVDPCENRSGEICTVAGNGVSGYTGDRGPGTEAQIYNPLSLELTNWDKDPQGKLELVVVDWNNHRIRVLFIDQEKDGVQNMFLTVAGDGKVTGVDALNHTTDVTFDRDGNLILAGWHNQNIYRYINRSPELLTPLTPRDQLAGLCDIVCGGSDDMPTPVGTTPIALPYSIEALPDGRLIFSELNCSRIRILTVTGTPTLTQPDNCIDPVPLFVRGTVQTLAGRSMQQGYAGDGGPARLAKFKVTASPNFTNFGIRLEKGPDPRRLYVTDSENNVIRYIDLKAQPEPTIHLFAGVPGRSGYKNGRADEALFNYPMSLDVDEAGNVYVADNRNHAIRKIDRDGTTVTTVAGTGRSGFTGDNLRATDTALSGPGGVVVHPDGRMFIADTYNNRIRVVRP